MPMTPDERESLDLLRQAVSVVTDNVSALNLRHRVSLSLIAALIEEVPDYDRFLVKLRGLRKHHEEDLQGLAVRDDEIAAALAEIDELLRWLETAPRPPKA